MTVIVDPTDYDYLLENMNNENEIDFDSRSFFSAKAFGHTAQYDTIIHNYLKPEKLSNDFTLTFTKHSEMRYGENPIKLQLLIPFLEIGQITFLMQKSTKEKSYPIII